MYEDSQQRMGVVKYAAGIEYVKGAMAKPSKKGSHTHGTYLIGTHREAATQNKNCTRIYVKDMDAYKRTTPVKTNEVNARNRFRSVAAMVIERREDLTKVTTDQAAHTNKQPYDNRSIKQWENAKGQTSSTSSKPFHRTNGTCINVLRESGLVRFRSNHQPTNLRNWSKKYMDQIQPKLNKSAIAISFGSVQSMNDGWLPSQQKQEPLV